MIATLHPEPKNTAKTSPKRLLSRADYTLIEEGFRTGLPMDARIERHLRGVVHDALTHPGSLARAQLAFSLMTSFGFDRGMARDVGIAIEYYHTASLLLDDLPCMDDATHRRGYHCPHKVHGESAAILGALALITQGYGLLWRSINSLPSRQRLDATALVNQCLGLQGILNGQAYDLHFAESPQKKDDVFRIARGKTVTLIRLTLMLPASMRGMRAVHRERLEQLATSWGLAYQILDDFKDHLMTSHETGKTTARDDHLHHPNLPRVMGADKAMAVLQHHLDQSRMAIQHLDKLMANRDVLHRLQSMMEVDQRNLNHRLGSIATSPPHSIA